jgi:hypothetical protein
MQRKKMVLNIAYDLKNSSTLRNKYAVFFYCALVFLCARTTEASLVEVDFYGSGDKLLTYDTLTGNYWLDLTATLNTSYDVMQMKLSEGGQLYGFRYATTFDIDQLQRSAGIPEGLFFSVNNINNQRVEDLIDMVGITHERATSVYAYGITSDPFLPTTGLNDRVGRGFGVTAGESALQFIISDTTSSPTTGSWLITDSPTPVPLPSALILFCGGVALITLVGRKKKVNSEHSA